MSDRSNTFSIKIPRSLEVNYNTPFLACIYFLPRSLLLVSPGRTQFQSIYYRSFRYSSCSVFVLMLTLTPHGRFNVLTHAVFEGLNDFYCAMFLWCALSFGTLRDAV